MKNESRGGFTSQIGFVLAAAGSAVGLGNLWRFPYLAAKDGGGLFLLVYIVLAVTFGFALMTTEISLGRKTGKSPINAFKQTCEGSTWVGYLALLIPLIIFPYYCVIGGWVCRYALTYVMGNGTSAVDPTGGFFYNVIGLSTDGIFHIAPVVGFLIFLFATALFIYLGVDKGIEKCSKVLMPLLLILILFIAIFSMFGKDSESGRTAMDGLKIYLVPNFEGLTIKRFLSIVLDAMGQMFYSMSLAMGIMITYGSYTAKKSNLVKSVNQIEFFDTGIAILAGFIMIPAVYCFLGEEGLSKAGPSLMFIALPQVFAQMGAFGTVIGALFFLLVIFAAVTSSISLMEAITSMIIDRFKLGRRLAATIVLGISIIIGIITCLGYNVLFFNIVLPNGAEAQILDVLDWVSNNLLMPIVAIATCIIVGWVVGTKYITDEVTLNGEVFGRQKLYVVMVKYVSPILLLIILLNSFGLLDWLSK